MKNLKTKFAVLLLSTLSLLTGAFGQITPSADSYTNTVDPTTNYGAKTLLDVDAATQATYIQFNLASIPSTYTSADITQATLKLYVNTVSTAGSFNVDYVNGTWAESTITSSLAPALGTTIAASVPITTADKNQFILIDVTPAVQAWLSGTTNDGIALVANGTFNATFDSKESTTTSHAPELDIVFGGTLSGVTTASGSGLTGGGASGTLNLGLLTTCASGQVLEWNGTAWACATGKGTGTITGVTTSSTSGLTGGGTSGTLKLQVNTALIPLLGGTNTFTGNQTVNGVFSASSNAFGVVGTANSTSGIGVGVGGTASSPAGYGVEGVNTATSGGAGVYGSSAASAGYGVEGQNTASSGGTGVYGIAPQFGVYGTATGTGKTVGVFGAGADGLQGSGTAHGVYGASSTAGAMGVYGTAPNFGVYGVASNTSSTAVGVFGAGVDGLQGSGSAYGVYASGTGASSTGVYGSGGSNGVYGTAANFGLYGVATATSGNSVGVFGVGIDGLQGSGSKYGVYAATTAGTAGTYGVYGAPSTLGSEGPWYICLEGCGDEFSSGVNISNQAGVWADSNSTGGSSGLYVPALLATADADVAAVVLNNTTNWPGALFYNWGGQDYTGGGGGTMGDVVGDAVRAGGPGGTCTLTGGGDAACTGVLKSVVATKSSAGAQRVETYSVQSAENWFEDAGTAQLVNGTGRVNLESVFGQTVNTGVEYHVFLTPDGDCKGLYVSAKTATGFEVRELGGGASSIAFEYRIMAKRTGYENVRLKNVTERFNKQEALSTKMRRPARPSTEAQSGPRMPAPPSAVTPSAPQMPTLPAMPSAPPRPEPVTSRLISLPPARAAVKPPAAQPK